MENERIPLRAREYNALMHFMGVTDACFKLTEGMEKRIKSIPRGWMRMKLIEKTAQTLLTDIFKTVPIDKVKQVYAQLPHFRVYVTTTPDLTNTMQKKCEYIYINAEAFNKVMGELIEHHCLVCDKTEACAKECEFYKDLMACTPFVFEKRKEGECPLAGQMEI